MDRRRRAAFHVGPDDLAGRSLAGGHIALMHIPLITPESARRQQLVTRFVTAGHECSCAPDAAAGLKLRRPGAFELILFGRDLPPEALLAVAPLAVPNSHRPTVLVTGVRLGDDDETVDAAVIAARFRRLAKIFEEDDRRPRTIRYHDHRSTVDDPG